MNTVARYIIYGFLLFCVTSLIWLFYDFSQEPNTNECYITSNVIHRVLKRDTRWYISSKIVAVFSTYNEAAAWQNQHCDNKVNLLDVK